MSPQLDPATVTTAEAFLRPAVESNVLPKRQYAQMLAVLRNAAAPQEEPATGSIASGLMTTRQVAEFLACSTKTVHRLGQQGILDKRYLSSSPKSLRWSAAQVHQIANFQNTEKQEVTTC